MAYWPNQKYPFSPGSIVPKIIDCYSCNQNDARNQKIHSEVMVYFFKVKLIFLTSVSLPLCRQTWFFREPPSPLSFPHGVWMPPFYKFWAKSDTFLLYTKAWTNMREIRSLWIYFRFEPYQNQWGRETEKQSTFINFAAATNLFAHFLPLLSCLCLVPAYPSYFTGITFWLYIEMGEGLPKIPRPPSLEYIF